MWCCRFMITIRRCCCRYGFVGGRQIGVISGTKSHFRAGVFWFLIIIIRSQRASRRIRLSRSLTNTHGSVPPPWLHSSSATLPCFSSSRLLFSNWSLVFLSPFACIYSVLPKAVKQSFSPSLQRTCTCPNQFTFFVLSRSLCYYLTTRPLSWLSVFAAI